MSVVKLEASDRKVLDEILLQLRIMNDGNRELNEMVQSLVREVREFVTRDSFRRTRGVGTT